MIFCEINNLFVTLYTILIFDYIHKYSFTYYLIVQYKNILVSIKYHLRSYSIFIKKIKCIYTYFIIMIFYSFIFYILINVNNNTILI